LIALVVSVAWATRLVRWGGVEFGSESRVVERRGVSFV
jgi:hypothetical protein